MSENLYLKRVKLARKKYLELTLDNEKELVRIYEEASKIILKEIQENKDLELSTDYQEKLYSTLNQYSSELNNNLAPVIKNNTENSSNIATDTQLAYIEAMALDDEITTILNRVTVASSKKALEKIVRGNFYKDGKSLDNRIWNITQKNVKDIDTLIKVNVAKGANARKLGEQLEAYINPNKRIEAKTLEAGMNSSISYQAQRLARTSISHTFSETCVENAKVNPFNQGLKWNLSPSHYERQVKRWGEDICDVYVNQDDYNLGNGVFPPDKFPVKHPNCLCYSTYVNTPVKEASKELKEWADGAKNEKLDKWYAKHNNGNKYNSKAYDELGIGLETEEDMAKLKSYFNGAKERGTISKDIKLENFEEIARNAKYKLKGLKTSNGIEIKDITYHLVERIIGDGNKRKGVSIEGIKDALDKPLKISDIKTDEKGRNSIKYIGETVTVSINPDDGNIIQVNPTKSKVVENLKKGD